MRTTAMYVEQVLIGAMLLVTAGLLRPAWATSILDFASGTTPVAIGFGATFVAVAYLVGILYDRIADTLAGDLERHALLTFALRQRKVGDCGTLEKVRREHGGDLYPIHEYRIAALQKDAAADYANYLRTRLRLMRAVATLMPAFTVGTFLLFFEGKLPTSSQIILLSALVGTYGLAFLLKLVSADRLRSLRGLRPPRTNDELEAMTAYVDRLVKRRILGPTGKVVGGRLVGEMVRSDRTLLMALVLLLAGLAVALSAGLVSGAVLLGAGFLLTAASGWAWWRINRTFLRFVHDFAHRKG